MASDEKGSEPALRRAPLRNRLARFSPNWLELPARQANIGLTRTADWFDFKRRL